MSTPSFAGRFVRNRCALWCAYPRKAATTTTSRPAPTSNQTRSRSTETFISLYLLTDSQPLPLLLSSPSLSSLPQLNKTSSSRPKPPAVSSRAAQWRNPLLCRYTSPATGPLQFLSRHCSHPHPGGLNYPHGRSALP